MLLAAATLARVDGGEESRLRRVEIRAGDLVPRAPIAEQAVGEHGLSVAELCDAAVRYSDNAAANLLMHAMDGPAGLTSTLRLWQDVTSRIDRVAPDLNEAAPGDLRDTTTPIAMVSTLERICCGNLLSVPIRMLLIAWMRQNTTGDGRLRRGLPRHWSMGDKTGSGNRKATHDVAVAWPGDGDCVTVAAFSIDSPRGLAAREDCLAQVGRVVGHNARP